VEIKFEGFDKKNKGELVNVKFAFWSSLKFGLGLGLGLAIAGAIIVIISIIFSTSVLEVLFGQVR